MSAGELLGLLMTVGLLAAAIGAILTAAGGLRRSRRTDLRARRLDVYSEWLAARLILTRASRSFVAAFRSLAAERRDSSNLSLRRDEAQRTRTAWCEARNGLDRAEAMLLVWSDDPSISERLTGVAPVSPDMLRTGINGAPADFESLTRRLREADEQAIRLVRSATTVADAPPGPVREMLTRAAAYVQSIVEHWSKR